MTAHTIRPIADLNTTQGQTALTKAVQNFPNKDFRSGAKSAIEYKYEFLVASGRLDRVNDSLAIALTLDETDTFWNFMMAHRRLTKGGASSTHWIVAGDTGFQQRAMQAAQSSDKRST